MREERIRGYFKVNGICEEPKTEKLSCNTTYLKKYALKNKHNIQEPYFHSSPPLTTSKKFEAQTDD